MSQNKHTAQSVSSGTGGVMMAGASMASAIDSALGGDGHGGDLIEEIKSDHTLVKRLMDLYENSGDKNERREAALSLIKELSMHSTTEECIVYPIYNRLQSEGLKANQESLAEHQAIKDSLYELDQTDFSNPDFHHHFDHVKKATLDHILHEERDFLPLLQRHLSANELKNLAAVWKAVKPMQPTRPHPKAPNTQPGVGLAGMAAKPIDELRDRLQGRR